MPRNLLPSSKKICSTFLKNHVEAHYDTAIVEFTPFPKTLLVVGLQNGFKTVMKLLLYASLTKASEKGYSFQ
jgi:hypothetical protein